VAPPAAQAGSAVPAQAPPAPAVLRVDVYQRQHYTTLFAIPARTVEIDPVSGRVFQGYLCADP
jgi:hypothetical protein